MLALTVIGAIFGAWLLAMGLFSVLKWLGNTRHLPSSSASNGENGETIKGNSDNE